MSNSIDNDYGLWLQEQIRNLQLHNWENLDIPHLVEEIEGLNRSNERELYSYLIVILTHLLKWQFQPDQRSGSWKGSIRNGRNRIQRLFKNQPSLKTYVDEVLSEAYDEAVIQAEEEMGQQILLKDACIYSSKEILDFDFLPD